MVETSTQITSTVHMEIIMRGISVLYPPIGQLDVAAVEAAASSAARLSAAAFSAAAQSASVDMVMMATRE